MAMEFIPNSPSPPSGITCSFRSDIQVQVNRAVAQAFQPVMVLIFLHLKKISKAPKLRLEYSDQMERQHGRGFVLIVTCVVLAIVLGLAGLGIDAGRLYVVKSEVQAFTDSASLSAAMELDGTAAGLRNARDAAASVTEGEHAMRWDLGS